MRDEEIGELNDMKAHCCVVGSEMKLDDEHTKTMILLQGYIAQWQPDQPTLFSDFNYISQNAGRITRALFEICVQRGWASTAYLYAPCRSLTRRMLNLCKSVEKRLWFTEHPLLQVPMHRELLTRIVVGLCSADER